MSNPLCVNKMDFVDLYIEEYVEKKREVVCTHFFFVCLHFSLCFVCVVQPFQKDIFFLQGIPDSITHPMEAVIFLLKKEYKESKDQVLTLVTHCHLF